MTGVLGIVPSLIVVFCVCTLSILFLRLARQPPSADAQDNVKLYELKNSNIEETCNTSMLLGYGCEGFGEGGVGDGGSLGMA